MNNCLNLINQRFGELVVIEWSHWENNHTYWKCKCSCGNIHVITSNNLRRGVTKSCGCLRRKIVSRIMTRHGEARQGKISKEFRIWQHIKGRCLDKNDRGYKNYGGRGITITPEWMCFENFLRDMGRCPKGYSIERVNNNGNYEPSNCKWIPMVKQACNKRSNIWITYNGTKMILKHWAQLIHFNYKYLYELVKYKNYTFEDILLKKSFIRDWT